MINVTVLNQERFYNDLNYKTSSGQSQNWIKWNCEIELLRRVLKKTHDKPLLALEQKHVRTITLKVSVYFFTFEECL